jgi:hypothetical protein
MGSVREWNVPVRRGHDDVSDFCRLGGNIDASFYDKGCR